VARITVESNSLSIITLLSSVATYTNVWAEDEDGVWWRLLAVSSPSRLCNFRGKTSCIISGTRLYKWIDIYHWRVGKPIGVPFHDGGSV